jgi:hypothetical protein
MIRPLALIEGDLAIPLPRPFDGLPPPFGTRRRVLSKAVHRAVEKSGRPARRSGMFPPGVKHILYYEAPRRKASTYNVDAALAEARRYLEAGKGYPRSSRFDHILAASIFAACTIALTWLLVTCSMKDAEHAKAGSVAYSGLVGDAPRSDHPKLTANAARAKSSTAMATANTISRSAATASNLALSAPVGAEAQSVSPSNRVAQVSPLTPVAPKPITPVESRRNAQAGPAPIASKPGASKRVHMALLSEAHANGRVTLSQATRPSARPKVSAQPEWSTGAARTDTEASAYDAPWPNWQAQRHSPSPAARMTTPLDNSWNDRMTQRRITDDPAAFHTDRGG